MTNKNVKDTFRSLVSITVSWDSARQPENPTRSIGTFRDAWDCFKKDLLSGGKPGKFYWTWIMGIIRSIEIHFFWIILKCFSDSLRFNWNYHELPSLILSNSIILSCKWCTTSPYHEMLRGIPATRRTPLYNCRGIETKMVFPAVEIISWQHIHTYSPFS